MFVAWISQYLRADAKRGPSACKFSELVAVTLLFAFTLGSLNADFLVVLLECSQVLASLAKLAFFHSLADIPMDESTLAVHEIELVVDAREHFGNGGRIANHAHCAHDLCQIASRHNRRRLVINATFESRGAPINELNSTFRLDRGHRRVHILGNDVAAIHKA